MAQNTPRETARLTKNANGWFSINRDFLNSDTWLSEKFTHGQAWIDLIGLARHKDGHTLVKGHKVNLKRGQLCYSMKSLAVRWGWSRGKVSRYLNGLEMEHQIEQHKSHVTTVISIINYSLYQSNGTTDGATNGQRIEQQTDINNKGNKENNDNKGSEDKPPASSLSDKKQKRFTAPTVDEVRAYVLERGCAVNAETFVDFYSAKGWMIGKNKVKDWRACVRTWERREPKTKDKEEYEY